MRKESCKKLPVSCIFWRCKPLVLLVAWLRMYLQESGTCTSLYAIRRLSFRWPRRGTGWSWSRSRFGYMYYIANSKNQQNNGNKNTKWSKKLLFFTKVRFANWFSISLIIEWKWIFTELIDEGRHATQWEYPLSLDYWYSHQYFSLYW